MPDALSAAAQVFGPARGTLKALQISPNLGFLNIRSGGCHEAIRFAGFTGSGFTALSFCQHMGFH
jgi:hypothetical protein